MEVERSDRLLGIGQFAEASGLSVPTLRHYHELGLLAPAAVDGDTGYRRYRPEQVVAARCIRALRQARMPLRQIRRLVAAPGGGEVVEQLAHHLLTLREEARRSARLVVALELALSRLAEGARLDEALEDVMEETEMAVTTGTRLIGIVLTVPDVERARTFYQQALGIGFKSETHPGGPVHYHACGDAWDDRDELFFTLWPGETAGPANVWFAVGDVDLAWRRALSAGATPVREPHDSDFEPRCATIRDPFGNCVSVYKDWR